MIITIAIYIFLFLLGVALVYDSFRGVSRISARIIADSVNPTGKRITTVEATFNRYILAELNTHRMLSRNSASSRAIPVARILREVLRNPAVPVKWGRNQAGMQARTDLVGFRRDLVEALFLLARYPAVIFAWVLSKLGLHKQIVNRIVEPWMWHTAIITSTEWENFFKLRRHKDAQPEFHVLADRIYEVMYWSRPQELKWGDWHLPYTDDQDNVTTPPLVPLDWNMRYPIRALISAARCARVSYVRQNEKREHAKDIDQAVGLQNNGHWSPLEHQAEAVEGFDGGNFHGGWKQFRKFFATESGATGEPLPRAGLPYKEGASPREQSLL